MLSTIPTMISKISMITALAKMMSALIGLFRDAYLCLNKIQEQPQTDLKETKDQIPPSINQETISRKDATNGKAKSRLSESLLEAYKVSLFVTLLIELGAYS